ncbi:MAG TPA: anti-sigma factor, partial [Pseudonocardia sp.]|nr:anti-sigma factor [Pseudonocardia sp.]
VCTPCREEVEALRRAVELARAGDSGLDESAAAPPERVWRAITDELGTDLDPPTDGLVLQMPAQRRRPSRRGHTGGRSIWRAVAVPAAAAVVALALGIGIGVLSGPSTLNSPVATSPLTPLGTGGPDVAGTVELVDGGEGKELVVDVTGPTGAPAGDYLEAWLMDSSGTRLYSLGALTPDADGTRFTGTFRLPDDLPLDAFGTVDVSAERYDGDPSHSGASLLRGPAV